MRSRWVIATTPANNGTKLERVSGCRRCVDARQVVTLSRSAEIINQPSDKEVKAGNQPLSILTNDSGDDCFHSSFEAAVKAKLF